MNQPNDTHTPILWQSKHKLETSTAAEQSITNTKEQKIECLRCEVYTAAAAAAATAHKKGQTTRQHCRPRELKEEDRKIHTTPPTRRQTISMSSFAFTQTAATTAATTTAPTTVVQFSPFAFVLTPVWLRLNRLAHRIKSECKRMRVPICAENDKSGDKSTPNRLQVCVNTKITLKGVSKPPHRENAKNFTMSPSESEATENCETKQKRFYAKVMGHNFQCKNGNGGRAGEVKRK